MQGRGSQMFFENVGHMKFQNISHADVRCRISERSDLPSLDSFRIRKEMLESMCICRYIVF
jgi:hypothetical protein